MCLMFGLLEHYYNILSTELFRCFHCQSLPKSPKGLELESLESVDNNFDCRPLAVTLDLEF